MKNLATLMPEFTVFNLNFMKKTSKIDMLKIDPKISEKPLKRIKNSEKFQTSFEKIQVMQESYNKRWNILIHSMKEDDDKI